MGCPKLTAPPCMLTLDGSRSNFIILAKTTTLKASFISHNATSSLDTSLLLSNYNNFILIIVYISINKNVYKLWVLQMLEQLENQLGQ